MPLAQIYNYSLMSSPQSVSLCLSQGSCKLAWRVLIIIVFEFQRVGCDSVLDSNALVDRCGICGGDGVCVKIQGSYSKSHTVQGKANDDANDKETRHWK